MKRICPRLLGSSAAAMVLCFSAVGLRADKEYYMSIADRNPFALRPPLPAAPEKPLEPEKPLAVVRLTGITTMFHDPKALFEITEAPGKLPIKPILKIGERVGEVELLAIDISQNQVTIKNGRVETNLTFEVAKSTPAPGGQVPGHPGMPVTAGMPFPTPSPAMPTVINPGTSGNVSGARGSAVVVGGNASPMGPTAASAVSAFGGSTPGSTAISVGGSSTPSANISVSGNTTIPSRVPRATAPTAGVIDSALQNQMFRAAQEQNLRMGRPALPLPGTLNQ